MLEGHGASYLITTLTARGDMGVEMVHLISYILMRGFRPQLDFQRPPYSPAGTHKRHVRCWPLWTVRNDRVATEDAFQYMKASEITVSHTVIWQFDHHQFAKWKSSYRGCERKIDTHEVGALLALLHHSLGTSTLGVSRQRGSIIPAGFSSRHWRPQRLAASASCGRLYGAYRRFRWRWGRSLLLCLQPPAWRHLLGRVGWTETEQRWIYVSYNLRQPCRFLWAWMHGLAQWRPLLFQPAPTDDGGCKPHTSNRRPQLHKATAQDTVRHNSTKHPRRH